jgi:hypothetical protein
LLPAVAIDIDLLAATAAARLWNTRTPRTSR